jgi:hypothetical protein
MIEVIDNFLDYTDFKKLQSVILGNDFPWVFTDNVVKPSETADEDNLFNFQFNHSFYSEYIPTSEYFFKLDKLVSKIVPTALIRIKANLYPVTEKRIIHGMHIDFEDILCKTAIFYMNTNNGCTIIGDQEVKSVENRFVVFDSNIQHSGTTCTDQKYRCMLNLNYIK